VQSNIPTVVEDVVRVADQVSKRVSYPIRNFKQLADALGGEQAEIEYEGRLRKVGQVKRMIPGEFFPIESREDLIAKVAHLQSIMRPDWPHELPSGKEVQDKPPTEPPAKAPLKPSGKVVSVRGGHA
jgi:hypothetical protein